MARASAGVPSQSLVAVAKLWRAAARISAGIKCENIASAGTTSMQLTRSKERSFMVSCLAIWGPALPGRFWGDMPQEREGDDSGRPAVLQSEIARKNRRKMPANT